jgi:hypothetical protein
MKNITKLVKDKKLIHNTRITLTITPQNADSQNLFDTAEKHKALFDNVLELVAPYTNKKIRKGTSSVKVILLVHILESIIKHTMDKLDLLYTIGYETDLLIDKNIDGTKPETTKTAYTYFELCNALGFLDVAQADSYVAIYQKDQTHLGKIILRDRVLNYAQEEFFH